MNNIYHIIVFGTSAGCLHRSSIFRTSYRANNESKQQHNTHGRICEFGMTAWPHSRAHAMVTPSRAGHTL